MLMWKNCFFNWQEETTSWIKEINNSICWINNKVIVKQTKQTNELMLSMNNMNINIKAIKWIESKQTDQEHHKCYFQTQIQTELNNWINATNQHSN